MKRHFAELRTILLKDSSMKKTALGFAALLLLAVAAYAGAAYNVTATLYNADTNNNAYTLQSDGSTSAAYPNGPGLDDDLTPVCSGCVLYYQWDLSFGTASSRAVNLTLQPIGTSPTIFSSNPQLLQATLYSRCWTDNTLSTYQNWTQIKGNITDNNCAMRVLFTYSGVNYVLVMSPEQAASGHPTGTASVTCTNWNTKSNSCVGWTDVPTPNQNLSNVANLYQGSNLVGQYYLSYKATLTHP